MVSVLMAVYNGAETVSRALRSLQEQTFQNWEAIVIDDGSTDGTFEVLQDFASGDGRIRPVRWEYSRGLAAALNAARRLASGLYLARQDADDWSYPARLERQVSFLRENPSIAVVGSWAHLFDDRAAWGIWDPPYRPSVRDWLGGNAVIHPSVMMRSTAFDAVGGYDERLRRTEDYDLFLRMIAAGVEIVTLPEVLVAYRLSGDDYRRRTVRARWEEVGVRWRGFRRLGLGPLSWIYVLKPLAVGIVPGRLMYVWHRWRFSRKCGSVSVVRK